MNLAGPLYALLAFALYATHDVIIKFLGGTYSPFQLIFFSTLFSFPLVTFMLMKDATAGHLRPVHPWWTALRTVLASITGFTAFYAFSVLPLAQTYVLLFASPLLITLLSIPMLGERVGIHRLGAVVVGLIGERAREVSDFVTRHMAGDRAAKTAIVAVPADHAANLRLRGAMLATSIAEHLRSQGKRVLLILDSLTRVAHAAREIGILLGEPGAARGYPPSALSAITKLIERAGNSEESGGAITGIYTVLADGDDQNDPVVDTARSILDGHIVLSRDIAQRGRYPAVDVGASLSRVMNDIVPPAHVVAARKFRALNATYEENRDLVLMGAYRPGQDATLDKAIAMHEPMSRFLGQELGEHVTLFEAVGQLQELMADDA